MSIIVDGKVVATNTPEKVLSYDEYDALSEEEKKNGTTYYVEDDDTTEDEAGMSSNQAGVYDTETTYSIGDFCIYNKKLYRCTGETTGQFDESKWARTTLGAEVNDGAIAFESGDTVTASELTGFTDVEKLESGETRKSIFSKMSTMFKNVRYLAKMLGSTDISKIGDGTVTGGLNTLNNDLGNNNTLVNQTLGYHKKNLLKNTASDSIVNGITYTVNDDGSITATGTATDTATLCIKNPYYLKKGSYILSGCPNGGGIETYRLHIYHADDNDISYIGSDIGNGFTFKTDNDGYYNICIRIGSGTVVDNLPFYPMIRDASITDDTYEPYVEDVDTKLTQLTSDLTKSFPSLNSRPVILTNYYTKTTSILVTIDIAVINEYNYLKVEYFSHVSSEKYQIANIAINRISSEAAELTVHNTGAATDRELTAEIVSVDNTTVVIKISNFIRLNILLYLTAYFCRSQNKLVSITDNED